MADDYVLQRDLQSSIRLDAQHLILRISKGYVLNPAISQSPEMKVAEIGTGTGIWLLDLASQLPQSAQLDGFDFSEEQFPHQDFWPANVTFNRLDAFGDVPDHLANKYDVVHMRYWCSIVRNNDPAQLIRHAAGLLKPGGYLQWEEADTGRLVLRGELAEQFSQVARSTFTAQGIHFDWLGNIPEHVKQQGLNVLASQTEELPLSLAPLCSITYLAGLAEMFRRMESFQNSKIPDSSRGDLLLELMAAVRQGAAYHWQPITLLAQKPSSF
ncbi:hypothetical protein N7517_000985 [Penicillium concentricum]|uniref:Methyltransferase domain-containing protein n=1 Tax=Penicillium concentricum TaxID=293559 RepID=A0A9W9ST76_9EURO|nr:uncharacterized protein N7517_000985 [Penicillium concentricum]KAJ5383074.1 hypothetical protein N7517_000985 [Penicillium concentricum]